MEAICFFFMLLSTLINTVARSQWLIYVTGSFVITKELIIMSLLCPPSLYFLVWVCLASLSAGNSILHSAADSVTSAVQKASQALNERGERLGRAEDRTADMMNSAEQFAVTAHKVRQYGGYISSHITISKLEPALICPRISSRDLKVIIGEAKRSNIWLNT